MNKRDSREWDHLTAGDLRDRLVGVPNDTPVFYERIPDVYFNNDWGWNDSTIEVPSDHPESPSEYIRAYGGGEYTCPDGKLVFWLTAHY